MYYLSHIYFFLLQIYKIIIIYDISMIYILFFVIK
nr:MAG TPA: hypothetical protein [Caudoviricetes sp.]